MLAASARQHGYRVVVLTGGATHSPAGALADVEICGAFDDPDAIDELARSADVVTWEFENVEATLAERVEAAGVPVRPSGSIIATAQDRAVEKRALEAAGVPVAAWRPASSADELHDAVAALGAPVIAKTARFGYDGKGQRRLTAADEAEAAFAALGGARLVVESVVDFDRELSVVIARGVDGAVAHHGVMENDHVDHILDTTITPAAGDRSADALAMATAVAESLDLVGVLCVELFETAAGLVVNEIAPRPHNSGHCTIEASAASQFDQQLRAVCGLPLGDGSARPAAMVQLLGDLWADGEPDWAAALAQPGAALHLYGKSEPRAGRKMGHITCVADSAATALDRAQAARAALNGR